MNEKEIMDWMQNKVKEGEFSDPASLAREFLRTHKITNSLDPDFSKALDAGFKVTQEIYDL
ncbi:MAG: hypothetical protein K9M75_00225 [Phycisphaerae bacterium]|nr:hypothetical protein [Phycisphaerae bacterium]